MGDVESTVFDEVLVGMVVYSRAGCDGDIVDVEDSKIEPEFAGVSLALVVEDTSRVELILFCSKS